MTDWPADARALISRPTSKAREKRLGDEVAHCKEFTAIRHVTLWS